MGKFSYHAFQTVSDQFQIVSDQVHISTFSHVDDVVSDHILRDIHDIVEVNVLVPVEFEIWEVVNRGKHDS